MSARRFALIVLAAALLGTSVPVAIAAPAQPTASAFLDLRSPRASVASYAAALRAERWGDACSHHSRVERTGAYEACIGRLATLGPTVRTLRVAITSVDRRGRYAEVRYRSSLGFAVGVATLELRHGDWLITGFLPQR